MELTTKQQQALDELIEIKNRVATSISEASWDMGDWYNDSKGTNRKVLCAKAQVPYKRASYAGDTCVIFPKDSRQREYPYYVCEETKRIPNAKSRVVLTDKAVEHGWTRATIRRRVREKLEGPPKKLTAKEEVNALGLKLIEALETVNRLAISLGIKIGNSEALRVELSSLNIEGAFISAAKSLAESAKIINTPLTSTTQQIGEHHEN